MCVYIYIVMYFPTYWSSPSTTSSSSILRACRLRFVSTLSSSLNHSFAPPSQVCPPPSTISSRSLSFSSAFRSLRCSAPRWSYGVDWRSPVSLRAQIRTASPVLERFERKIATMGMMRFILCVFVSNSVFFLTVEFCSLFVGSFFFSFFGVLLLFVILFG